MCAKQIDVEDGVMTFTAVTTTIDFNSYETLPESYDPSTYFDATEVLSNSDDNGVLEDMQKGFVGLALDVFADLDGESEMSVSMSMREERQLRGSGVSFDRALQDISFLIGGNLTTEVADVGKFQTITSCASLRSSHISITSFCAPQTVPLISSTPLKVHLASCSLTRLHLLLSLTSKMLSSKI